MDTTEKFYKDELYLSRALAREIYLALGDGKELPLNVVSAYNELMRVYQQQTENGVM